MSMPIHDPFRPPLVGADTWSRVLGEAGWRCECAGECGRPHVKTGHRCGTQHGNGHRLSVVSADPSVSLGAAVSGGPLSALCPGCVTGAQRASERAATDAGVTDQLDLFPDLTGGDAA